MPMKKTKRFLNHVSAYWFDELRIIFHDWGAILIFFVAILVYTVIYSIAYQNEVLRHIPVALVDLDHSATSRKLARMIDATEQIHVSVKPTSLEEAKNLFYEGKVNGIVLIPSDSETTAYRSPKHAAGLLRCQLFSLLQASIHRSGRYHNPFQWDG